MVVVYGVECVVVYVLHVWLCMGLSVWYNHTIVYGCACVVECVVVCI